MKKRANSFLQTYGYKASVEEGIELLNERISQDIENVNKKAYSFGEEAFLLTTFEESYILLVE